MSENKKSFLEQMSELWPNLDFSNSIYINYYTKIEFICSEHGKQYKLPKYIKKYGCGICSRKNTYKKMTESNLLKIPQEDVIKECNEIHNNRYNYSLVKYKGSHVPIVVICPIHGQFETLPHNHKRGVGCIKCRNNLLSEKYRSSTEDFIEKALKIHGDKYSFPNLGYTSIFGSIQVFCNTHKRFFYPTASNFRQGTGCPYCKLNKAENFLTDIFEEYNIDYLYNDRRFINPLEIDILVDSYKFGIEHNGLVYHSYGNSNWSALNNYNKLDKQRHLNKTKLMEAKDYQLFHIREDQLRDPLKKDIWKSILLNKCNISNKIHARKLQVVNLGLIKEHQLFVKKFLDENHLQGSCNASIQLGLQDPKTGVIYSIMTFGVSRFNKNIEWELLRF